jgi:hypothetical protein
MSASGSRSTRCRAGHAGVRGRLAPRALADAAHLHGPPGALVPRRQPGRAARHRGPPRRTSHPGLGAGAGRPGGLPHAVAACLGRGARPRRRVFSVRFLGDDMRHAPRRWKTSPDFPGLADRLPAGAAMDHPLFPGSSWAACHGPALRRPAHRCTPQPWRNGGGLTRELLAWPSASGATGSCASAWPHRPTGPVLGLPGHLALVHGAARRGRGAGCPGVRAP